MKCPNCNDELMQSQHSNLFESTTFYFCDCGYQCHQLEIPVFLGSLPFSSPEKKINKKKSDIKNKNKFFHCGGYIL